MAKSNTKNSAPQAGPSEPSRFMAKISQLLDFFEESKVEIKKVVWPSRKETIATSVAVLIFTLVVTLFLGLVDGGLSWLVNVILS
ncbi:MAG: preprotein translocase subunit SecE [Proteobacteria bacterium]|nr:preprotein translocase subunit SecE [Pseudomonadota bacterium]